MLATYCRRLYQNHRCSMSVLSSIQYTVYPQYLYFKSGFALLAQTQLFSIKTQFFSCFPTTDDIDFGFFKRWLLGRYSSKIHCHYITSKTHVFVMKKCFLGIKGHKNAIYVPKKAPIGEALDMYPYVVYRFFKRQFGRSSKTFSLN